MWLHLQGDIKKVAACRVKPYELVDRENSKENDEKTKEEYMVMLEDGLADIEALHADMLTNKIGAENLTLKNSVSFSEMDTYTVELPASEHKRPGVIVAKRTEVENLMDYSTFEEVEDDGQETIGSRWVVTQKEKHDGQKTEYKARLVARGFQERLKPQSDSPTAAMESFKLLMVVAANNSFRLASLDIRAAFLQSKALDRDVYI